MHRCSQSCKEHFRIGLQRYQRSRSSEKRRKKRKKKERIEEREKRVNMWERDKEGSGRMKEGRSEGRKICFCDRRFADVLRRAIELSEVDYILA